MGSIRKLRDENVNAHLLLTSSSLSEMYIYDILKEKCKATRDSIYEVNTKSSINSMLELVNVQPFLADKWLFVLTFNKVKKILKEHIGIFEADTAEFLIEVKNYKEYKEAKELLGKVNLNDIYLSYIRRYDVEFLLGKYNLSQKMLDFVVKSYASDPEQVFILMKELDNGLLIENRKQIVDVCGVSVGSLNYFALSLLKEPPKTAKGQKSVCRNRMKVAVELADTYGYGKMRNFLMACVKDILDIKQLYINGVIYDKIRDLPDVTVENSKGEKVPVYDEKRLSKYNIFLQTIIDTPYTRIVRLYLMLKKGGRWFRDVDMMNFIYQYYEQSVG